MIKPIYITPLNTTNVLAYECKNCVYKRTIYLTNYVINTDNTGNPLFPLDDYECFECNEKL